MTRLLPLFALSALTLAACTQEEEPVANQFDRKVSEIEEKAKALESEVENQVDAVEARMQNEIDAFSNQSAQSEANEALANEAAGTE